MVMFIELLVPFSFHMVISKVTFLMRRKTWCKCKSIIDGDCTAAHLVPIILKFISKEAYLGTGVTNKAGFNLKYQASAYCETYDFSHGAEATSF
jgi:hypothetical protein